MMRLFRRPLHQRLRQDDYRRAAPRLIPLQPQRPPADRLNKAIFALEAFAVLLLVRGCAPAFLHWVLH